MPKSAAKSAPEKDLTTIFASAEKAFRKYSELPISQRIKLLGNLQNTIIQEQNKIAKRINQAVGKPVSEALLTEVLPTIAIIDDYRKNLKKYLKSQRIPMPIVFFGMKAKTQLRPSGVALIISPWNFPFYLAITPLITAIAAGNTAILKPSEYSPDIGTLCLELFTKAGFPKNTISVVYGDGKIANALIYMKPSRIFFTGSTGVGRLIGKAAGELIIPTILELGGKAPMLVFSDTNLERATNAAVFGAFCNCGQVCVATSRIYVAESIYDDFTRKVTAKTLALPKEDLGKIVQPQHVNYLQKLIKDAISKGAKKLCGSITKNGFTPIVLANVTDDMQIMQMETFGPIMPIAKFSGTEQDAINLANNSEYGLSASIFTNDSEKAHRVANKINAGNININNIIQSVAIPKLPFGGIKQSGIGRYHGQSGIRFFSDEVSIAENIRFFPSSSVWLPYGDRLKNNLNNLINGLYGKKGKLSLLKSLPFFIRRNFRK